MRTEGIYTIMITLAIGVAFFYLVQQNYSLFNGFQGFQSVQSPRVLGVELRDPVPFYYLALFWALAGYFGVQYLLRAPFGVALQGIRDNPRRMAALGFHVTAHRVAAYAVAGLIAAVGGILLVWYNGLVSPGSVGTSWLINILVIAVLGGMRHPIGPFIGAVIFVLLQNFAVDLVDRERFNLLIGGVFLVIVLFSPDGVLGWWAAGVAPPARAVGAGAAGTSGRGMRGQLHSRGRGAALTTKEETMRSLMKQCMRGLAVAAMVVAVAGIANAQQASRSACSPPWKAPSRRAARTACAAPSSP